MVKITSDGNSVPLVLRVHSSYFWNAGIFLIYLGAVVAYIIPTVFHYFEIGWRSSKPDETIGAVFALFGFLILTLPHKVLSVEPGKVTEKDGPIARLKTFIWEGNPVVRLVVYDACTWEVIVACGKFYQVLDRRIGRQMESRSLAEGIARALHASLIEEGNGEDKIVPAEELKLSFRERALLHPNLTGPQIPRPEKSSLRFTEGENSLLFDWAHTVREVLPVVIPLLLLVLLVGSLCQMNNSTSSALDLAFRLGDYSFFLRSGLFLILITALALGHHNELALTSAGVSLQGRWCKFTLKESHIAMHDLQDISLRQGAVGARLSFMSKDRTLEGWVSNVEVAAWIAYKAREFCGRPLSQVVAPIA